MEPRPVDPRSQDTAVRGTRPTPDGPTAPADRADRPQRARAAEVSGHDSGLASSSWFPTWGPFKGDGRRSPGWGTATSTTDTDDHGPGEGPSR
jgi:hypothetical protein